MLEVKHKPGDILIAIESGSGLLDNGKEVRFTKGRTRVRAGSDVAKKWPDFFAAADVDFGVEDASDEPGRKRGER